MAHYFYTVLCDVLLCLSRFIILLNQFSIQIIGFLLEHIINVNLSVISSFSLLSLKSVARFIRKHCDLQINSSNYIRYGFSIKKIK